jgi:anti-sigma factor RsiW
LTTANEISCAELVEIITDYLEGTMQEAERRRFEAHLDECPYCVNYLEQVRLTNVSARGWTRFRSICRRFVVHPGTVRARRDHFAAGARFSRALHRRS